MRWALPAAVSGDAVDPRWYAWLYDRLGPRYDDFAFTRGAEQEVAFLVQELAVRAGARVLDVGCGTGRHAVELAARGFAVTGVDLSLRLLEIALERARERDAIVNFMHADAREIELRTGYDLALSLCEGAFGLLESDDEDARVLARMWAALRPGGHLALNALNRLHLESRPGEFPGWDPETGYREVTETMTFEHGGAAEVAYRERWHSPEELRAAVAAAGFTVLSVHGCMPGDFGRHPADAARKGLLLLAVKPGPPPP